jgi:hypothetical protein
MNGRQIARLKGSVDVNSTSPTSTPERCRFNNVLGPPRTRLGWRSGLNSGGHLGPNRPSGLLQGIEEKGGLDQ